MRNLCQIFSLKPRRICAIGLILCLICGLTPTAESISVKLRGKIALGGILSGLAYVTYTLVKRDKRAMEALHLHLGPPDRVIRYERGFDRWRIHYYGEQCYLFRNNRFIKTAPCTSLRSNFLIDVPSHRLPLRYRQVSDIALRSLFREVVEVNQEPLRNEVEQRAKVKRSKKPFLIDTPVSGNPRWLQLYLSHPQRAPQLVSSYLYRLEAEHLLGRPLWLSRWLSRKLHLSL